MLHAFLFFGDTLTFSTTATVDSQSAIKPGLAASEVSGAQISLTAVYSQGHGY
jgi:hypothetical protein